MNYKKLLYFTLGFAIIFNGLFLVDIASLPLKDDLYLLGYLGYLNQFFSLDAKISIMQTAFSSLFFFSGFVLIYKGVA